MRIYTLILANFFAAGALLFSFVGSPVTALTNPFENNTAVTATVIDRLAPSTPILIAPEDDEKLKTGEVQFTWQESTDNWLMDHYTLVLNDEVLFDNIPLTATSSSDYSLEYDSITGYYTLTVSDDLDDDDYTWSITAWDYHGNSTSSVIWSFTVDTQAPEFIITLIEDQIVEITTGDVDSVPTDPIVLTANQPTLSGTGEKNSTVELTLTYPDGSTVEVTFEIDGDGEWSVVLETLPRDGIIYLDFLITDETGNISILEDVPLILYTQVVNIPLPQLPGLPLPTPETPAIEIPVLPPTEYVPPVIRRLPKNAVYFVRNSVATVSTRYVGWLDNLMMILVPLLLLLLPLLKLSILSSIYRQYLSSQQFKEFLWLIGWWPERKPQGIVVARQDQKAVSFSLVLFSGKSTTGKPIRHSTITNEQGVFPVVELPDGEYRVSIQHPHYFFPTLEKRPGHLDMFSYYTGASLTVKNGSPLPSLVIPVERLQKYDLTWFYLARKAFLLSSAVSLPLWVLLFCLCLAFPSPINIAAALVYSGMLIKKKVRSSKKRHDVAVVDTSKQPLPNTVLIFQSPSGIELVTQTSVQGIAAVSLPPGEYLAWCVNFEHSLAEGDNKTTTTIKIDASDEYLPLVMKKA